LRLAQGYRIPLIIREAKLLEHALGECIRQNLLATEVSHLVPDMIELWDTIYTELETLVRV